MEARKQPSSAALLFATVAMAGLAVPAIVLASIVPSTPAPPPVYQVPPSDHPTPKPRPTPTPDPTPPPTPPPPPPPTPIVTPPPAPTPAPTVAPPPPTPPPPPPPAPTPVPPASQPPTLQPPPVTAAPVASAGTPGGPLETTPAPSAPSGGPLVALPIGGPEDAPPGAGAMVWVSDLGPPIAYLALVILVAMVIARRRVARSERRLAAAGGQVDLDTLPVKRYEPVSRPIVPDDDEASMPRWLRPSVRAERFGMDVSHQRVMPAALQGAPPPPARAALAFGSVPDDLEDQLVLPGAADLLDRPDQASGELLLRLRFGDQVAILERAEGWLNVLTPTGVAGWLAAAAATAEPASDEVARETEPPVSWVGGRVATDEPLDLAALLAAGPRPVQPAQPAPPAPTAEDSAPPMRPRRPGKGTLGEPGLS